MKFKDKLLGFFGLGCEEEPSANSRSYDAIKSDIPKVDEKPPVVPKITQKIVVDKVELTPIEGMIITASYDPAQTGLSELKSPGEKLRHVRKIRRMTQSDLSELTGVSCSTIGEIENGKWRTTSLETACALATELDVAVTDIWSTVLNK